MGFYNAFCISRVWQRLEEQQTGFCFFQLLSNLDRQGIENDRSQENSSELYQKTVLVSVAQKDTDSDGGQWVLSN